MKHKTDWDEAKKRCKLSDEEVRMARELGFKARSLIKNIPSPSQSWKAPIPVWIRSLYEERMEKSGRAIPAPPPQSFEPEPPPFDELEEPPPFDESEESPFDEPAPDWEFEDIFDDDSPPTPREIDEENRLLLRRQRDYRLAAEYVAAAFAAFPSVRKVVLFGSVAVPLKKEIPRFRKLRRHREAVFHECKDVDLAVWLDDLSILKSLQRARGQALNRLLAEKDAGVAHHQVDVFLLEPGTNRYLGHLCNFGVCPKGKPECRVRDCGAVPFLQRYDKFAFRGDGLAADRSIVLLDRSTPASTGSPIIASPPTSDGRP
jgi:hypothetical protein